MSKRWRILIIFLIIVVILQSYYIWLVERTSVVLPEYYFSDVDENDVVVKGTWLSNTKLSARNSQTSILQCSKEWGYCIDMNAQIGFIGDRKLTIYPAFFKIEHWSADKIEAKNEHSCVTYNLSIDRKNKTVTSVRNTKIPKPKGCENIQDEPIFMHLGDAYTNK